MNDDKVIGLRGQPVLATSQQNIDLVKRLEQLLEMARSGEAQGILGVYVYRDGSTGSISAGIHSYSLVGRAWSVFSQAARDLEVAP